MVCEEDGAHQVGQTDGGLEANAVCMSEGRGAEETA